MEQEYGAEGAEQTGGDKVNEKPAGGSRVGEGVSRVVFNEKTPDWIIKALTKSTDSAIFVQKKG